MFSRNLVFDGSKRITTFPHNLLLWNLSLITRILTDYVVVYWCGKVPSLLSYVFLATIILLHFPSQIINLYYV